MKKTYLLTAICLTAISAFGSAQARPPSPLYGLAFEEDFNKSVINPNIWSFRTDNKAYSVQLPANVAIVNGQLSLGMKKEKISNKEFSGSGIVSKAKFGYGYYEVTAKTTTNQGWHNSWWMMAGDGSTTFGPGRHLEIDSFVINTAQPEHIDAGLNMWKGKDLVGRQRCKNPQPTFNSSSGYHIYGVDWREGFVDFYIDSQPTPYCTIAYPIATRRQDPVNLWLTALAYRPPITVGGTAQLFEDVRFYRRDAYVYVGDEGYVEEGAGWKTSRLPGFGLMPARYSCLREASTTYRPRILQTGDYDVYIWKTAYQNSDPSGEVAVTYAGGTNTMTVNFRDGASGWVKLGRYKFNRGTGGQVLNTLVKKSKGIECTRASAVKFVRT